MVPECPRLTLMLITKEFSCHKVEMKSGLKIFLSPPINTIRTLTAETTVIRHLWDYYFAEKKKRIIANNAFIFLTLCVSHYPFCLLGFGALHALKREKRIDNYERKKMRKYDRDVKR